MLSDTLAITINHTSKSRLPETDMNNLSFGREFSDHMLTLDYRNGQWEQPVIQPYEALQLSPASSVLHYGQTIFEGLKAFRNDQNEVLLFRPDMNEARMNHSARRMCMPELPENLFLDGLKQLLDLDRNWIPGGPGQSLYIRPFMIATDDYLGVKPSDTYRFMIITSPSGSYYSEPVRVKIETFYSRAVEGGTGSAKAAGNYAGSLYPARLAQQEGFHQLIWTDAKNHEYIEEAGTMNIAFILDGKLVTPPLSSTILNGVTRNSVLTLARDWGMEVEERPVAVKELVAAANAGTLHDAFGVGTAATIAPIAAISFEGDDLQLPPLESREFSLKMGKFLNDLKRGHEDDPYGWVIRF